MDQTQNNVKDIDNIYIVYDFTNLKSLDTALNLDIALITLSFLHCRLGGQGKVGDFKGESSHNSIKPMA